MQSENSRGRTTKSDYYMTTKSKYFFVSKSKSNTNFKMYTPAPKVKEHTIVTQCVFCLVCNNFFHIFLSKNNSQKFYTLFVWACHLRGFIFVTVIIFYLNCLTKVRQRFLIISNNLSQVVQI